MGEQKNLQVERSTEPGPCQAHDWPDDKDLPLRLVRALQREGGVHVCVLCVDRALERCKQLSREAIGLVAGAAIVASVVPSIELKPITYPTGINQEKVIDLLCCVFDSNWCRHWAVRGQTVTPKGYNQAEAPGGWRETYCAKYTAPTMGGRVDFFDSETFQGTDKKPDWILDGAAIQRGLDCFVAQTPRAYADAVADNEDAETGDIFLQLCLLGEVIYG